MAKVFKYGFMWEERTVPEFGNIEYIGKDRNGLFLYMGLKLEHGTAAKLVLYKGE